MRLDDFPRQFVIHFDPESQTFGGFDPHWRIAVHREMMTRIDFMGPAPIVGLWNGMVGVKHAHLCGSGE